MTEPGTNEIGELLGVQAPWQVMSVAFAAASRQVVVRVEHSVPRGGFFSRREAAPIRRQLRWEQPALGGWRCQIHLGLRDGERAPVAPWTGEEPQGFSRALTRLILDLLLAGASLDQLCVLLRLPIGELWRFKYRLDQGRSAPMPTAAVSAVAMPAPPSADADLPPEDAPLWTALLLGRAPLQVRTLGLKLLLGKLQREAQLHDDADLHQHAAQELRRYLARNRAVLGHELSQLGALARAASQAPVPMPPPGAARTVAADGVAPPRPQLMLPDASDPLWLGLLEGAHELDTRTLGLKLLLAKLRTQISVIRDDEVRMVKLVELHRYFERHQALLGHEIAQLQTWAAN